MIYFDNFRFRSNFEWYHFDLEFVSFDWLVSSGSGWLPPWLQNITFLETPICHFSKKTEVQLSFRFFFAFLWAQSPGAQPKAKKNQSQSWSKKTVAESLSS